MADTRLQSWFSDIQQEAAGREKILDFSNYSEWVLALTTLDSLITIGFVAYFYRCNLQLIKWINPLGQQGRTAHHRSPFYYLLVILITVISRIWVEIWRQNPSWLSQGWYPVESFLGLTWYSNSTIPGNMSRV